MRRISFIVLDNRDPAYILQIREQGVHGSFWEADKKLWTSPRKSKHIHKYMKLEEKVIGFKEKQNPRREIPEPGGKKEVFPEMEKLTLRNEAQLLHALGHSGRDDNDM